MGLQEEIKELKVLLLEQKAGVKEKKFRFPFGKKVGRSQKKKNFTTILLLNENGTYDFKKYQIEDQTIMHDLIPRLASSGHVMFDKKGNPLIILPNWSVEPFSPLNHFKETMVSGANTTGYRLLLNRMENSNTDTKKKLGGAFKWILGLGLLGLVIYALVSGGGGI